MSGKFLKGAGILTLGNIIANFLNFLFYFIGKKLSPDEFGIIVTILSAYLIFSIPHIALKTYITRLAAKKDKRIGKTLINSIYLTISYFVIFLISIPLLKTYLRLESLLSIICLLVILLLDFPIQVFIGFFTGIKEFTKASICQVCLIFFKLIFGISAVLLFSDYDFILIGLALSSLVTLVLTVSFGFKQLSPLVSKGRKNVFKEFIKEILNLSLLSAGITILGNIDQLVVTNSLSPEKSGQFAVLKTFGKLIVFTNAGIIASIIPFVAGGKDRGKRYLSVSSILTGIISFAIVLLYSLVPEVLVGLAFSDEYKAIASLLPFYGISMAIYTMIYLVTNYLISLEKNFISIINFLASIAFFIILNTVTFSSIFKLICIEITFFLILFAIVLFYSWQGTKETKK